ncbi:MAG: DNA repair protein RecN [Oscillospiraceae bacterium]|nr:DNA repair protein RecN [Oscillospiraceae bacterium]
MLRELNIENVAVIEKASVQFDAGLNILTGETGAGKSILIDSINAILGNRTTKEIVRTGASRAVIWATFADVSPKVLRMLEEQGYEFDGMLILHRIITADGKSQCRVNGKPATAATVRDLCAGLINIHGQHDNQALLDPEQHIRIIDDFAELGEDMETYRARFAQLGRLKRQIDALTMDEAEKTRKLDLLRFQVDEIDKAQLTPAEDEQLSARRNLIRNAEKLMDSLRQSHALLEGDSDEGGAVDRVSEASGLLDDVKDYGEGLDDCAARLSDLYYGLRDVASEISDFLDGFDFDQNELEMIEERLDLIYKLKKKYGATIPDILRFCEESREELENIETSGEQLEQLQAQFDEQLKAVAAMASSISGRRKAAFEVFSRRIREELTFLNMPNVEFTARWDKGALTSRGFDVVEFLISTNVGEPPKPLSKIASGGELSRIMLAIKNALADKDDIGTLIFDEIDTGVSGAGAGKIGKKLKQAAETRQIICVTHSAQIAAFADSHLKIEKSVRGDRTYTDIEPLDADGRTRELARIISGDNVTPTALQNAAEMLSLAKG